MEPIILGIVLIIRKVNHSNLFQNIVDEADSFLKIGFLLQESPNFNTQLYQNTHRKPVEKSRSVTSFSFKIVCMSYTLICYLLFDQMDRD